VQHRLSKYGNYNILTNTHIWVISCEHIDSHTSMCQNVSVESQYMWACVYYKLGNSKAAAHVVCRPQCLFTVKPEKNLKKRKEFMWLPCKINKLISYVGLRSQSGLLSIHGICTL